MEAMIYVAATVYFWKISQHWFPYVFVGFIWQAISVILVFFMPESPRWLGKAGRSGEQKRVMSLIYKPEHLDAAN